MNPLTTRLLSFFLILWSWSFGEDSKKPIPDEKTLLIFTKANYWKNLLLYSVINKSLLTFWKNISKTRRQWEIICILIFFLPFIGTVVGC